jgi:hypothetical protein
VPPAEGRLSKYLASHPAAPAAETAACKTLAPIEYKSRKVLGSDGRADVK